MQILAHALPEMGYKNNEREEQNMKKQYVDLWGKNFLYVGERPDIPYLHYEDIFEAYDRPSSKKIETWNQWLDWARQVRTDGNAVKIAIASRNTFSFTIEGSILASDGNLYGFRITQTRNHYWSIP